MTMMAQRGSWLHGWHAFAAVFSWAGPSEVPPRKHGTAATSRRESTAPSGLGLLALLSLWCAGCGNATGEVSGKVSYQGKPLNGGTITFVPEKGGGAFNSPISEQGTYIVTKVPTGPAKVAVRSPGRSSRDAAKLKKELARLPKDAPPEVRAEMERQAAAKDFGQVPDSYGDYEKSGLTCTVKGGPQEHNIELK
jgi:hypothetical protein